jgi:hypothetical protein
LEALETELRGSAAKELFILALNLLERSTHEVETTERRAVCGRTACTVRREGTEMFPIPIYLKHKLEIGIDKFISKTEQGIYQKFSLYF